MLITTIKTYLELDAPLMALLSGGIWDRGLKREGPMNTAAAFEAVEPFRLMPCAIVTLGSRNADATGPDSAYTGSVTIWLHAHENEPFIAAIDSAASRVQAVLHFAAIADDGLPVEVTALERLGLRSDPMIPGAVLDYVRFQIAGVAGS